MGRFRLSDPASDLIAWLGLILMASAFVILTTTREPSLPYTSFPQHKKTEPFALVILDPGHGGQDSGAMAGNVLEKDLTFDIAERVDRLLGSQGIPTLLTRTGDSYVSLTDRAKLINRADHAIVVSIHFNDGPRPEPAESRPISQPNEPPANRGSQVGCLFCKRSVTFSRTWKVKAWPNLFRSNW